MVFDSGLPLEYPCTSPDDSGGFLLKGGILLNVYSGELIKADVVTRGERIWYVGSRSNDYVETSYRIIEVDGRIIVPGYIEPHFHPWDIYNPLTAGEEACRLGTTTLFCDNLIFHILMGTALFEEFMRSLKNMPIKFFWTCRATPQSPMKDEATIYSIENIGRLLRNPYVKSLGEITRWPDFIRGDKKIEKLIMLTKELSRRVDGHTAGSGYEKLNVIARAGVESCHESINSQDVIDRLRLGFYVMLRQSSLRPDLSLLLKSVTESKILTDRLMLTSDGSMPHFYHTHGISDYLIRIAIQEGIDPISAYRMATINPAVYFGLDHRIGGIAPGRDADMVILQDIQNPTPEVVISMGRIVSEKGRLIRGFPNVEWERFLPKTAFSKVDWVPRKDLFAIPSKQESVRFPVIKLVSSAITRISWTNFISRHGFLDFDPSRFSLVALVSRDGSWITVGILEGFGTEIEGLASSYNTAAEILVIGNSREAMSFALNKVLEMKGGIVILENGSVCYELPLPIGGIMSEKSIRTLAEEEKTFKTILESKGYPYHDPLYTLVFLPNDFLPDVRINYLGIVDIKKNEVLWPRTDLK